jgi:hypothetical protein
MSKAKQSKIEILRALREQQAEQLPKKKVIVKKKKHLKSCVNNFQIIVALCG